MRGSSPSASGPSTSGRRPGSRSITPPATVQPRSICRGAGATTRGGAVGTVVVPAVVVAPLVVPALVVVVAVVAVVVALVPERTADASGPSTTVLEASAPSRPTRARAPIRTRMERHYRQVWSRARTVRLWAVLHSASEPAANTRPADRVAAVSVPDRMLGRLDRGRRGRWAFLRRRAVRGAT